MYKFIYFKGDSLMKNALNFGTPIKLRELALADEPTVAKGGLFYNSDYDKYRIYEDGAVWDNIVSETVLNTEIANLEAQILAVPSSLEWQESVLDIVGVGTLPGSHTTGDRYLLNDGANINKIAEWNGTAWVYTTPTVGTFVSVDNVSDGIYFWGSAWPQATFSWESKTWENPVWGDGLYHNPVTPPGTLSVKANVDGTIIVDGGGVRVGTIGNSNITDNTISGDKLLYASVDGIKLIENTVSGAKLVENSVYGIKLIDNSVSYTKLNSDVWTYIQNSVVLYDDVTIGKNGSKQLYVKDCAITTARLADELDTATKAVKIMGAEGLFVSRLRLNLDTDYTKYAEETYVHAISLTGTATTVIKLSSLGRAVVEYSIKLGSDYRVGTLYIAPTSISDEFVEDVDLGITWEISLAGVVSVTVAVGTGLMSCTIKTFLA